MMENYTEIPVELNKPDSRDMEEMQKKLIDMITKNEKLKEKNEYLQKEVEDAKAVGERALCEVQELTEKNKRLVEEHSTLLISIYIRIDISTIRNKPLLSLYELIHFCRSRFYLVLYFLVFCGWDALICIGFYLLA